MDQKEKLITCILPKGVAVPMMRKLKEKKGIVACYINNARGVGQFTHRRVQRLGDVLEKEILNVVIIPERADEIFEFIYYEADVNRPHGGFIFLTKLSRVSHFELPDIPEEED